MSNAVSKLLRNTASNFVFRLLNIVLAIVTVPILLTHVGDEGYGLIVLMGAVLGYFRLFNFGIPTGTVKYVAELDAKSDAEALYSVVDTSLAFFVGVGVVVAGSLTIFASLGGMRLFVSEELVGDASALCYIAAAIALFSWSGQAYGSTLLGLQRHHTKNIIDTTCRTLSQLATIAVAVLGYSLPLIFLARQIFTPLRVAITALVTTRALGHVPNPFEFSRNSFKMIFGLSALMAINQLAILLNFEADKIIIGVALPVGMIAMYSILSKPGELVQTFSVLINSAVMPAVSSVEQTHGSDGVDYFIYRVAKYVNALIGPFAIIASYLAAPFIALWVGEKYLEGVWIAQLMCVSMLIWQANSVLARVYFGTGRAKKPVVLGVLNAVANVMLSILLVGFMGVEGVLLATIVTGISAVVAQYFWILPDYGVMRGRYFVQVVVKPYVPALVFGLVLLPFAQEILSIRSWPVFIATGAVFSGILFPISAWTSLEEGDAERLWAEICSLFGETER